jgi:hypothetical protein
MHSISRPLFGLSLLTVACLASAPAQAVIQTGSFSFDNQTVHYLFYTGQDSSFFQNFVNGGTLTNFETPTLPAGVTPFSTNTYNNGTASASNPNNFISQSAPFNGIFFSSGGQTPGNPLNSMAAIPTIPVTLDNLPGAHSGTNVLAPTDFNGTNTVAFIGGFFSFGVQTAGGNSANTLSRIGFATNPLMAAANAPNIHVLHSDGVTDQDQFLTTLGITTKIQPGDFFAIAFDKPIIQEVEFVPGLAPGATVGHGTIDDVVYARDNKVAFVPEPASWAMLAGGIGLLLLLRGRKRLV